MQQSNVRSAPARTAPRRVTDRVRSVLTTESLTLRFMWQSWRNRHRSSCSHNQGSEHQLHAETVSGQSHRRCLQSHENGQIVGSRRGILVFGRYRRACGPCRWHVLDSTVGFETANSYLRGCLKPKYGLGVGRSLPRTSQPWCLSGFVPAIVNLWVKWFEEHSGPHELKMSKRSQGTASALLSGT